MNCFSDEDFVNFISQYDLLFFCETWQTHNDIHKIPEYGSVCIPRKTLLNERAKQGYGGISLFYKLNIQKGICVLEKHPEGILWIKLCRRFFKMTTDVYVCFAYVPPNTSPYYRTIDQGFF